MDELFIAGVDGGGTKTECLLSDISGRILGQGLAGPSNPRNQGIDKSAQNILLSIKRAIGRKNIRLSSLYIAIAAAEEEYSGRLKKISDKIASAGFIDKRAILFGGDQEIAFRAATDENDGVLVIAGTGSVVRGWKGENQIRAGGRGYLADEGSAFWVGQKAYQAIINHIDLNKKTLITKIFGYEDLNELNRWIYADPTTTVPQLSTAVDLAAEAGDKTALLIMEEGANELAGRVNFIEKSLKFRKEFPLIASGGMFKSKAFVYFFEREIKKEGSFANFIISKNRPVVGAIKMAREKIYDKEIKKR